jgi:hypothetical protein
MREAPSLRARDMDRVAEVTIVLGLGQPRSLTGGLAGATTIRV